MKHINFTIRDQRLKELGFENYHAYLESEHWKKFRASFLRRENLPEFCWGCRVPKWVASLVYGQGLNPHHLNYERLGREEFNDLVVLCRRCHGLEHSKESTLPKLSIHPCKFKKCKRPMLFMEPKLAQIKYRIFTHDFESAGAILENMITKSPLSWSRRKFEKIKELTEHPLCKREAELQSPEYQDLRKKIARGA